MLRLIQADIASTGKPHLRNETPSFFLDFRALNALLREGSHFGFQIPAHEIELMDTIFFGRVKRSFCRRQGENEPPVTRIHGFEAKDIAEKCAVFLSVLSVNNYVGARDHLHPLKTLGVFNVHHVSWNLKYTFIRGSFPDLYTRKLPGLGLL